MSKSSQAQVARKKNRSALRCDFCGGDLVVGQTRHLDVDVHTLLPIRRSYRGKRVRMYFCSDYCKVLWLESPKDECIVCRRAVRTDVISSLVRHEVRGGLDFYVCDLDTPKHRRWSEIIDDLLSGLEEDDAQSEAET